MISVYMGNALDESVEENDRVYGTGKAAEICGVDKAIIIKWFDEGRLKGFRIPTGARVRRILQSSLIEFMEEHSIIKNIRYYTTGDVAKYCKVTSRTVSTWFDQGLLDGYRIPGSQDRRILPDSLVKLLKENGMYEYLKDNIPE